MGLFSWIFKKPNKKLKIGIALGGGGARGFSHIGVIKALEEAGIKPTMISGTSAGSLVGAVWASGKTGDEIEKISETLDAKDIKTSKMFFIPSKATGIENVVINAMGGDLSFEDLKVPFYCVTTNIMTGQEVVWNSGKVAKCVSASCAFPGFFAPVNIDGQNHVDGGLLNNNPCDILRKKCDIVIGVDINSSRGEGTQSTKTLEVVLASYRIMSAYNSKKGVEFADVVISPDMRRFKATKIIDPKAMIAEGYKATKEALPTILHLMKMQKPNTDKKTIKQEKKWQKKHTKLYGKRNDKKNIKNT